MRTALYLVSLLALTLPLRADDQPALDTHLEALRPLLGKTWQGTLPNSKPDKPAVDVMRWERALNGKAVRILHSINDGAYGGESIVLWDAQKESVSYYYFTTAGFMTTGTMTFQGGKIITHEVVSGSANGVTEVRGTSELRSDGTLQIKTEYLTKGQWQPGRDVLYRANDSAEVRFK